MFTVYYSESNFIDIIISFYQYNQGFISVFVLDT